MAVKINARILLELGAELISSDQIALYELVKNSLDARAKRIDIIVNVLIQRSEYLRIFEALERAQHEGRKLAESVLEEELKSAFESESTAEARREFIEAVLSRGPKNYLKSFADAYKATNWISVRDNGSGMSLDDLQQVYLNVGTPNRLIQRSENPGQPVLGEKGIGRLSAVRLGDFLRVETSKAGEKNLNILDVDWSLIKSNVSMSLDEFPADPERGPAKQQALQHGSCITISNLMSDWSEEKLAGLAKTDFAKLVNPFLQDVVRPNINLRFNDRPVIIPGFEYRQLSFAHANCTAEFGYDENGEPQLTGEVHYKTYGRDKTFKLAGIHLRSALALRGKKRKKNAPSPELGGSLTHGLVKLGGFKMEAYWFNRQKLRLDKPPDYEAALAWLTRWGGGLLLYRDNFRVYPYAEARDDWLDLDGVALATGGYKMNRKQLVGAVCISSAENPRLQDQTNREGLRDTEEKAALIALLRYVLMTEFKTFLNSVEGEQEESAAKEFPQLERRLEEAQKDALKQVQLLRTRVTEKEDVAAINTLLGKMADMAEAWERSKLTVRKYQKDMDSYVHLAGVGLMTEFIFHELGRVSNQALQILQEYKSQSAAENSKLRILREQLITLDRRIRVLDPLSTPGRQQKEDFDLVQLLRDISEAHEAQWNRHNIVFDLAKLPKAPVVIRAVKGQVIQIIENLIANSVYWMRMKSDVKPYKEIISVGIDTVNRQLLYFDNGPGIPEDRGDEVFNAFFTTKPAGEGRGMGLYISRKLADGNDLALDLAPPDENRMHRGFILKYGRDNGKKGGGD